MINVLKSRDDKMDHFYKINYSKKQIKYVGLEISKVYLGS